MSLVMAAGAQPSDHTPLVSVMAVGHLAIRNGLQLSTYGAPMVIAAPATGRPRSSTTLPPMARPRRILRERMVEEFVCRENLAVVCFGPVASSSIGGWLVWGGKSSTPSPR